MWSVGKNIEDTYQTWKRKFNNVLHINVFVRNELEIQLGFIT